MSRSLLALAVFSPLADANCVRATKKYTDAYSLTDLNKLITNVTGTWRDESGYAFAPLERAQFLLMAEPIFNNKDAKKACQRQEFAVLREEGVAGTVAAVEKQAGERCCKREKKALQDVLKKLGKSLHKNDISHTLTSTEKVHFLRFAEKNFKFLVKDKAWSELAGLKAGQGWGNLTSTMLPKLMTAKQIVLREIKEADSATLAGYIAEADPLDAKAVEHLRVAAFTAVKDKKEFLALRRIAKPPLDAILLKDTLPSYDELLANYDAIARKVKSLTAVVGQ